MLDGLSSADQIAMMLLENVQRSDLSVYEQADGFWQLKMNFGMSVDDISKKTGFSESTIRRRIKVAELGDGLREVCEERQINLDDALKVCKIKDEGARSEVISALGTKNFEAKLSDKIEKQNRKNNMDRYEAELQTWAEKVDKFPNDTDWWDCYSGYVSKTPKKPELEDRKFYYTRDACSITVRSLRIRTEEDDEAEEERRTAEEERKAKYNASKERLIALAKRMYELRISFVKTFRPKLDDLHKVNKWNFTYDDYELYTDCLCRLFGLDGAGEMLDAFSGDPLKLAFLQAYGRLPDTELIYPADVEFSSGRIVYEMDDDVRDVYDFLRDFGYEISDEEQAFIDGTHEIYGGNG